MKKLYILLSIMALASCSVPNDPAPLDVVPTKYQVEWQKMEMNMFVHFGPNTFTAREWGNGTEDPNIFNPTDLDCNQWAETAAKAGFKGVIITAKHHDGFCLWPNPVSNHTVAQSSWRDGKGDVLRELSDACAANGLKFGVYVSPWDRNDPHYGTDEYNEVFRQTLESALGDYGHVFEQWFDGACGEGPNGKRQVYDWELFRGEVYKHQPHAIIFSNVGPGCRWVGNEDGKCGETSWGYLDTASFSPSICPPFDTLTCGNKYGSTWIPAETDVSIRPGWFYKDSENDKVKSLSQLLEIYYASVGRNSLLLLNVPADTRGHLHEIDSLRLMEFRAALDDIFSTNLADGVKITASNTRGKAAKFAPENIMSADYDKYWATDDGVTSATLTFNLDGEKTFNRIMLQEYIPLGQRIAKFNVEALCDGEWTEVAEATTIGYKRILLTDMITTTALRVNILDSKACPIINGFGLFLDNQYKRQEDVERLNDVPSSLFKIKGCGQEAIDEDLATAAVLHAKDGAFEPIVLTLDKVYDLKGFTYAPADRGANGCIMDFRCEVSLDGKKWTQVKQDAIDNIVNNPTERILDFAAPAKAKFIRLTVLRSSAENSVAIAELGIVTK